MVVAPITFLASNVVALAELLFKKRQEISRLFLKMLYVDYT